MAYSKRTPIAEPIELRFGYRLDDRRHILAVSVQPSGLLRYDLERVGSPHLESMSNLDRSVSWPRKAVAGWQAEVLFLVQRLKFYTLTEVR